MSKKRTVIALVIVAAIVVGVWASVGQVSYGYVKLATPGLDSYMNLRSSWWNKVFVRSTDGAVKVRVATYKPGYTCLAGKKDGKEWTISGRARPWGKLATIKVEKDQTTVVKLGPPLLAKANVRRRGQSVSIGFSLIGQAGEHWSPSAVTARRSRQAPRLKIVDESAKVLASGKMEYG